MTDDSDQAGYFYDDHIRDEVPGLIARHDHLVRALQETEDQSMRSDLAQELRRVSQQIAELTTPDQTFDSHEPHDGQQPDGHNSRFEHSRFENPVQEDQFQVDTPADEFADETSYDKVGQPENVDDHFSAITSAIDLQAEPMDDIHPAFATNAASPPYDFEPVPEEPQHEQQDFANQEELYALGQQRAEESTQPFTQEPVEQFDYGSKDIPVEQHPVPRPAEQGFASESSRQRPIARPPVPFDPPADDGTTDPIESESTGSTLVSQYRSIQPSGMVLAVVGVCLVLLAGLLWFGGNDQPEGTAAESVDPASPTSVVSSEDGAELDVIVSNVRAVLTGLGLSSVVVDHRDGVIHVGGPVPSQADYDAAASAARAVSGGFPVDTSALVPMAAADAAAPSGNGVGRPEALQSELNRILAGTPLIFASGQASLSELHLRVLNNVVSALSAYPGFRLTIAGFTDELGDDSSNEGLSLSRANSVKEYLVSQGLPAESFDVQARGEGAASGSAGLAGLERRVEFEVEGTAAPADDSALRIAIVAPSASNDLAFTQSMVDAVNLIAAETPIELSVTDNTFVPDEAGAAIRSYSEQGFDLVIAHGSQFGALLIDIAPQFPETAFAWGTASDTFGLPNVYAYDAAAQQGGFLLGALASMVSGTKVLGVVGPIEVGDAALFVNGFQAGALAQTPSANVLVSYTGSFSDTGLATETADAHIGAGADVLTGSAQMVVGAVSATEQAGALWFGTQSNQTSLAPGSVVASQVYKWEVALRPIIQDIRAGKLSGTTYTADLANGGLAIEYNPGIPVAPEVTQRIDQLTAEIVNGSLVPPG